MKLSEIKKALEGMKSLSFQLPNGTMVPPHFHITEIGMLTKDFIDCSGVLRHEKKIMFQLWSADDYEHRLHPEKLLQIIDISIMKLDLEDIEVELEYQGETIERYGIEYTEEDFMLVSLTTDCLAKDSCGVPPRTPDLENPRSTSQKVCIPGMGCC